MLYPCNGKGVNDQASQNVDANGGTQSIVYLCGAQPDQPAVGTVAPRRGRDDVPQSTTPAIVTFVTGLGT